MRVDTLDKLIWTLVYGGLIAVCLGIATRRSDAALGWLLVCGGGVVSVVGAALIVVRSRMKEPQ